MGSAVSAGKAEWPAMHVGAVRRLKAQEHKVGSSLQVTLSLKNLLAVVARE